MDDNGYEVRNDDDEDMDMEIEIVEEDENKEGYDNKGQRTWAWWSERKNTKIEQEEMYKDKDRTITSGRDGPYPSSPS